jgi:hypothetical protein
VFPGRPRARADDGPEVSVVEGPAGRETLALIEDELRPMRASQATLDYGDRISNAPGSTTPSRTSAAPVGPSPVPATLTIQTPSRTPAAPVRPSPGAAPLSIFELLSFEVRGAVSARFASPAQRRRFVETHLLARLPGKNMNVVDRVEVTSGSVQGSLVVRVWCKI